MSSAAGRCLFLAVLGLAGMALPRPAQAAISVAGTVGGGYRVDPNRGRIPTMLMVTPRVDVLPDFLRFDVGVAFDLPDVKDEMDDNELELQIRPSFVVQLPIIYGRAIIGAAEVLSGHSIFMFGGAVGIEAGLVGGLAVLGEVGFVPRSTEGVFISIIEGHVGLAYTFDED